MRKLILFIALSFLLGNQSLFSQVPSYVPTNGLVGYWPFSGNASDGSGNGNNGIVNGATLIADRNGIANSAYGFNGFSSTIDYSNQIIPSNNSFTISIWVYANNGGLQEFFHQNRWPGAFYFGINNGFLRCGDNWQNTGVPVEISNWIHFVIVRNYQNNVLIYKNGIQVALNPSDIALGGSLSDPLVLGKQYPNNLEYLNGKLDDIGIWNRALTPQEVTALYTSCTTPAPTGTLTQTFCATPAPTVASLTVTGTGIQWYAAANGGTALATTTALVNGTTYYASQTVSGCESTTRLAVTVTLNDPQITASATTICSGTPVTLSASTTATVAQNGNLPTNLQTGLVGYWPFNGNANDVSGNANNGTVNGATLTTDRFGNANSAYEFNRDALNYITFSINNLPISNSPKSISVWVKWDQVQIQNAFHVINYGAQNQELESAFGLMIYQNNKWFSYSHGLNDLNSNVVADYSWTHLVTTYENGQRKIYVNGILANTDNIILNSTLTNLLVGKAVYFTSGSTNYFNGKIDDISIYNRALSQQEITQLYNSNQVTYLWSTGDTTATINPTPTATTTYWCDVTVNGVTCRKSVTVTVNTPVAPTGALTQTFCATPAPTIASLTVTGTGIQWYAAANGGTALATTTALVNATTYYASQTVSGCESTTRLAVTVSLNDPQITASATNVCSGTPVNLTASTTATVAQNCNLPANLQTGLVGYWPFCGNANDASGNANNGTVNGATLTTDRFGNANSAYNFDGVGNNIVVNNPSNLPLGNSNRSFSCWFNYQTSIQQPTYNDWNSLICYGDFINTNCKANYLLLNNNQSVLFAAPGTCIGLNTPPLNIINNWHFATMTYENGTTSIYIDNQLISQNIMQGVLDTYISNLFFGMYNNQTRSNQKYNLRGKIDEIGIWNRALSPAEISQLYTASPTYLWSTGETTVAINPSPTTNTTYWCDVTVNGVTCRKSVTVTVNTPVAPTGALTQTFCATPVPTIASLTATGTGIQWYAAATGGTALATTTALVNATTYYASQTVSGCESTTRLAVTVTLNDPQITASATTVCSGTAVNLGIANTSTSLAQFQAANTDLILFHTIGSHSYFYKNLAVTWQQTKAYGDQIGVSMYVINDAAEELSVYNSLPFRGNDGKQYWIGLYQDLTSPNYSEPSGGWKWVDNTPLIYANWYPLEPNNSMNGESFGQFDWAINGIKWNDAGNSSNNNGCACDLAFPIYEFQNQTSYLWSTGDTTATINPSPTATTTYWCDVTVNGVTCRKSVTVTVNTPVAPTGALTQTFCATPAPTLASLTATGTGIQWYAAATGGTALATTTALVNGTTYYASQTVSGCESTTRLAVTVTLNDPQITASATTVCSGTPVTLSASTTAAVAQNCNLPANLLTGLVGYWPFCGNANDASGNANNGTVNGATLTTDRFGNANSAYSFNGNNNIVFQNLFPFNQNSDATISIWINSNLPDNGFQGTFLKSRLSSPDNNRFNFFVNPNSNQLKLNFDYRESNVNIHVLNIDLIPTSTWKHIIFVRSLNSYSLYINGLLSNIISDINPNLPNSIGWLLGDDPSGNSDFNGKLDDIAIYNRALSQAEISQLYTAAPTYLWSTGDTTATINPSPTATTTYWCDVTINGVTCRKSLTITVNTTPVPTGNATQTFCATPAPTIASLTATGTGIQWYAAATGGTALATTTALVNGTTYYASQTVSGCESTARLAVTVTLNDPQITASATTVCSGTPVTLSASTTAAVTQNCNLPANLQTGLVGYWPFCGNANDVSGNANNGTVNGATLTTDRFGNANSAYSFDGVSNYIQCNSVILNSTLTTEFWYKNATDIQTNTSTGHPPIGAEIIGQGTQHQPFVSYSDFAYGISNYGNSINHFALEFSGPIHPQSADLVSNSLGMTNQWNHIIVVRNGTSCDYYLNGTLQNSYVLNNNLLNTGAPLSIGARLIHNSFQGGNQITNYYKGDIDNVSIWNRALSQSEITQLYTAAPTYLWSTGATTATINPSPTATTTYWCDVTINGVTCRKSVTITVNTTPTPTGTATQTFCATPAPTTADLTATGTGVQWYAAANGGTALATTTALVNGTTYYASQTVSGCESTTRLAVTVSLNDPQITASATTVCSGTPVNLSASTTAAVAQNGNLPTNLQTGLIGYWPFNGNANDVSGNANNGTVNGATLTTDRFGNANSAYSFDGNDYLSGNLNIDLNLNFTISSWVNPQSLNGGHFVQLGIDDGVTGCNGVGIGKGGLTTYTNDMGNNFIELSSCVAWNPSSYQIANNIWSLLTITKNNQGILYFVNGSQVHSISSTSILPSNGNFYFGSTGPNPTGPCYYKGMLDEILVYNRALSPSEIAQLYTATPTYLWSTGETTAAINPSPTTNTTYWCDVTVNGVTCRKSITINVNPNITPTFTQVAAICYGAPAPTLPTNSIENITGTWSPAFNNTATTLYTFTPTAGLCATPSTMTVTVNPIVTPTFTQVGSICYGAPAPILPTNSIENITGTWAPAFNNTATTTYTFTPTAGLCATTATMTVTVNPLPIPSTGVSAQTFCANIYPTLQNIVVNPSNVNWYNSTTSTTPLPITSYLPVGVTTYYASQYDLSTGCESNIRLAVSVNVLYENSPSTIEDQTYCSSDEKTIGDLKTGGLNILWYTTPNGGTPVSNSIILSSSSTLYAAIFNPVTGCESPIRTKVEITIINCQLIPNNLLTLNDNDLNDNLNIQNIENFPVNQIEIYNRLGELVWKTDYYDNTNISFQGKANVSGVYQINNYLPTGTYYFILKYYDPYHLKYNEMKSFLYINNNN